MRCIYKSTYSYVIDTQGTLVHPCYSIILLCMITLLAREILQLEWVILLSQYEVRVGDLLLYSFD